MQLTAPILGEFTFFLPEVLNCLVAQLLYLVAIINLRLYVFLSIHGMWASLLAESRFLVQPEYIANCSS